MKFMTARAFFDTNVLVYAMGLRIGRSLDPRSEKAEELVSRGGMVSVQVLNEFVDVASRKMKRNWETIAEYLQVIEALCGQALPLTAETHSTAVELSSRYGYRIYDSLILAAAMQAGCTTLFTEDMQHGQTFGKLTIVNPFLAR
jgi:predicted nucleic acid-binding protein